MTSGYTVHWKPPSLCGIDLRLIWKRWLPSLCNTISLQWGIGNEGKYKKVRRQVAVTRMWLLLVAIYVAPADAVNWQGSWELGMTKLIEQRYEAKKASLDVLSQQVV